MAKTGYAQHDAGILDADKLSQVAKDSFIKDVKEQLLYGTDGLPVPTMPCGPKIEPIAFADTIELENKDKFPGFHENWLGTFEKIAVALDVQSQFMFLPVIMDPIALASKLQLDVPTLSFPDDFILFGTALPLLAAKLGFDLPTDLVAKFPSILIPSPPIPNVPLPPKVDPELFPDLALHLAWPLKLPKAFAELILQMPVLFTKILQFDLGAICDVVFGSGLFGNLGNPGNVIQLACAKVLTRKTAECILIAMVGGSVGSSSGGIVGALGRQFGYTPPTGPATFDKNPRDRIVSAAQGLDGKSWSTDKATLRSEGNDISKTTLPYTEWILPISSNGSAEKKKEAFAKAKEYSSCGLFVRGCYFRGGATDPYFTTDYRDTTAISGLLDVAKQKGAYIPFSTTNMPALKRGDAVLVQRQGHPGSEHVFMITNDYGGGFDGSVSSIEGGQLDRGNEDKPTAVKHSTVRFFKSGGTVSAGTSSSDAKTILKIFDAEKMVNNA